MFNRLLHAAVHRNAAIFALIRACDHIWLPQKFSDDISDGSRVQWTLPILRTYHITNL